MSIEGVSIRGVQLPNGQVVNAQHVAQVVAVPNNGRDGVGRPTDEWAAVVRMAFGRDQIIGNHLAREEAERLRDRVAGAIFLGNITTTDQYPPEDAYLARAE